MIHQTAIIDPSARIAENVTISPYAIIGADVEIATGTWIGSHVVIQGPTKIGKDNKIFQFCSIGESPQDLKYHDEVTQLIIGDRNIFREYCSVHRGTIQDEGMTVIGNDNSFLAYVHIAHDCRIKNRVIFSNNVSLAGHVTVNDYVVLGGFSGVHQFCHLGEHCFSSAGSLIEKDILPFTRVANESAFAKPFGLNLVGLRRRGFSRETIDTLNRAYKIIYRQGLLVREAIEQLEPMVHTCPEINSFINFLKNSQRGIIR